LTGVVLIFLGGIFAGVSFIAERFSSENIQFQVEKRASMVGVGIKMFKDSPLIGLGWEGYYHNFGKYSNRWRQKYSAHNMYITSLANYGVLGFIPFMAIFIYPLIYSIKILRSKHRVYEDYVKDMAIICLISILPFMASGYFSGGMFYQTDRMFLLYSNIAFLFSSLFKNIRSQKFV
jgi:O-antigen ligase